MLEAEALTLIVRSHLLEHLGFDDSDALSRAQGAVATLLAFRRRPTVVLEEQDLHLEAIAQSLDGGSSVVVAGPLTTATLKSISQLAQFAPVCLESTPETVAFLEASAREPFHRHVALVETHNLIPHSKASDRSIFVTFPEQRPGVDPEMDIAVPFGSGKRYLSMHEPFLARGRRLYCLGGLGEAKVTEREIPSVGPFREQARCVLSHIARDSADALRARPHQALSWLRQSARTERSVELNRILELRYIESLVRACPSKTYDPITENVLCLIRERIEMRRRRQNVVSTT